MIISEELIKEIMQEVIDNFLIPKFNELEMNASGNWLKSLEIRTAENRGEIWGTDYTEQLVRGRKPGKMPPIEPLEKWIQVKLGLGGIQARSAAFAIANKIKNEGTTWYEKGGSDLLEVLNSQEVSDYVNSKIADHLRVEVKVNIQRMINDTLNSK